jgi:hypothetical protein
LRATIRSLGVIPLAALAVAAKGGAQVRVELTPFAGAYMPTSRLFDEVEPYLQSSSPAHHRRPRGGRRKPLERERRLG